MAEQRFSGPSAPTKTAATQRTSQRAERAIEHCERKRAGAIRHWRIARRRAEEEGADMLFVGD